ncbi:MAG: hypothetical protein AAF580_04000 [Pseudomonadota bacterium]
MSEEFEHFADVEVLKRLIAYAVDEALRCDERVCADFLVASLKVLDGDPPALSAVDAESVMPFRDN